MSDEIKKAAQLLGMPTMAAHSSVVMAAIEVLNDHSKVLEIINNVEYRTVIIEHENELKEFSGDDTYEAVIESLLFIAKTKSTDKLRMPLHKKRVIEYLPGSPSDISIRSKLKIGIVNAAIRELLTEGRVVVSEVVQGCRYITKSEA